MSPGPPPARSRSRALIGVIVGAVGTVVFGWVGLASFDETARLGAMAGPVPFVLGSSTPPASASWASLRGGEWDCLRARQVPRSRLYAWLLGHVESTQVPIVGPPGSPSLVLKLDGDQDCAALAGTTVFGVLVPRSGWVWSRQVAHTQVANGLAAPDLVFLAGETPAALCCQCLGLLVLGGLSACLLGSSWRAWHRPPRRGADGAPCPAA